MICWWSWRNFERVPYAVHSGCEFVVGSRNREWVALYLIDYPECDAVELADEGGAFWLVGLPEHLAQVVEGERL
ncbi:hypothetical protein [Devosia sp.]|uniref:hypothetical protein n=1 Tax=Devosia sp. TaxID=1871048 RepID=UPI0019DA8815|nr:hypothetical protein [Devosia sp.]MBE0581986.1 hypothetical protein [Devosia sp.]